MNKTGNTFRRFRCLFGITLATALTVSQTAFHTTVRAAGSHTDNTPTVSDTFENHLVTRVDEMNESGFVRSHLEDSAGNIYTDDNLSTNAQTGGTSLKKAASLPARYDLRDYNLTTPIRDQGLTGCCWAFSAVKAMESNGIKTGLLTPETADFSESHLAWFSYSPSLNLTDPMFGDGISVSGAGNAADILDFFQTGSASSTYPYTNGGSAILASFTLAKWSGTEQEQAAPFHAATEWELNSMAASMAQNSHLRYDSYAHMQNAICYDEYTVADNYYYRSSSMITEMKQSILEHGAMSVALYYNKNNMTTSEAGTSYLQTEYSGASAVKAANHCVTIIGWDDTYSRDNFSSRPAGDGAWLIANSYGTEFGDNGYFWLSYYDQSICDCYTFLAEPTDNYDHIYQYDGFGWSNANYSNSYNIKAANIFTADSSTPQQLKAVSFYTITDNQPYKIQVYRGVSSQPTNGTLIAEATTSGTILHNGYHTIPLASPVSLEAGESFSVVVTYIQSGSAAIYVPFEGKDTASSSLSLQYSSKKGQSFLYTKLSNGSARKWHDTSVLGYNNVCVKAFTNNTDSAEPLPTVRKKITLGKGESCRLSSEYDSYASSDTNLAEVSDTGKVTAKAVGTTTIQVTKGDSTFLIRVAVKKAPSSLRVTPSGKKRVRRGKSFRLHVKLSSGSASNKITYHSSRRRIASVSSSGKVTCRRRGTTVIRARTYNGKTARLKVIVK